ncbi:hypothetical protein Ssi03_63560 [Sphaerisporangium siamense]|uniref:Uncharacterized protein n=1 Tax=Sphaerisporangium siamense TaxID=795645 RepID=A0A7W7D5G3_9ACTN|nr:hypothetical protein [Sphaerisporangium siamense]MBB4700471.1 hypothetical protein [Sphaerisporangium siamense]GII88366.1 hypothetical protein Ssi03_63560 [Sphaerisporangium siamense]
MNRIHALVPLPQRVLLLGGAVTLLTVPAAGAAGAAAHPAPPKTPPPAACASGNGGFEQPGGLTSAGNLRTDIPAWHTTAGDGAIEIWGPGNAGANGGEVAADSGRQFAELNGTQVSTLYQDVATNPRTVLVWRIAHRARSTTSDQKDIVRVKIGTPGAQTVQIPLGQASGDIADGGISWGHYTGIYRVPRGQRVTRIAVESVSSAAGSPSYGNFLDSVEVFCTPPCPKATRNSPKACDALGLPIQPRQPVTPGARPAHPVTPPYAHPVTPPGAKPVSPPYAHPVTPPGAKPVTPPYAPDAKPVTPATPIKNTPVKKPVAPPIVAGTPLAPPSHAKPGTSAGHTRPAQAPDHFADGYLIAPPDTPVPLPRPAR